ncbi:hypothetical protein [Paenibacillus taichungensis]
MQNIWLIYSANRGEVQFGTGIWMKFMNVRGDLECMTDQVAPTPLR